MQLFGINTPFAFSQRTASLPDSPRRGPGAVAACLTCRVPRALPPASALRCSRPTWVAQGSALYRRRTSLKRPRLSRKFEGGKQAPLYVCRWENHQESKMLMRFLVSLLVVVPAASFAPLAGPSTIKLRPATLRAVPHPARGPTAGFRMLSMQSKPEATEQLAVPLTLLRVAAGVLMIHHG